jgi:hypothetical protein
MVPAGFYTPGLGSTSTSPELCRACNGKGIVFVPGKLPDVFPPPNDYQEVTSS